MLPPFVKTIKTFTQSCDGKRDKKPQLHFAKETPGESWLVTMGAGPLYTRKENAHVKCPVGALKKIV
tara:strand:+ start:80 stop:280 length:201 start_codon:yes stop_codon:yes gene_type:complete